MKGNFTTVLGLSKMLVIQAVTYLQFWLCERQEVWFVRVLFLTTKNSFPAQIDYTMLTL